MRSLSIASAIAATACAAGPAEEAPPVAAPAAAAAGVEECMLSIRFGSYAMGIDRGAAAAAEQLIAEDRSVTGVTRSEVQREGEYALCVRTASRADALRLFERIRAAVPADPRGPVTLIGPGVRFSAPRK